MRRKAHSAIMFTQGIHTYIHNYRGLAAKLAPSDHIYTPMQFIQSGHPPPECALALRGKGEVAPEM